MWEYCIESLDWSILAILTELKKVILSGECLLCKIVSILEERLWACLGSVEGKSMKRFTIWESDSTPSLCPNLFFICIHIWIYIGKSNEAIRTSFLYEGNPVSPLFIQESDFTLIFLNLTVKTSPSPSKAVKCMFSKIRSPLIFGGENSPILGYIRRNFWSIKIAAV